MAMAAASSAVSGLGAHGNGDRLQTWSSRMRSEVLQAVPIEQRPSTTWTDRATPAASRQSQGRPVAFVAEDIDESRILEERDDQ
jgi:hypothetical protein